MYQVIQTYSTEEPWWFFEDWTDDITLTQSFETFEDAEATFLTHYKAFNQTYEKIRCKAPYLVAFWNDEELIYCDDCDEDLQAFKGLMIVKDMKKLDDGDHGQDETTNYSRKAKCCPRFSEGLRSNQ